MHIKRKTKKLIFGIIVVLIGITVGIIPIFYKENTEKKENTKVNDYIKETSIIEKTVDKNDKTEENSKQELLLILEIPKINLKKGVYPLHSEENTIEKNVAIMNESSLPTELNGNVVLEAHNGTAAISYFNQLHKLSIDDQAYIYYQGTKYIYVVDKIYDVKKDGDVEVNRNTNKNTLTLITCKKNTNDRQLVIILYLSSKEEY